MSTLAYAPDERRPPVQTCTAGDGFVQHWAGHRLSKQACAVTLCEHLAKASFIAAVTLSWAAVLQSVGAR